ncbi:rod shape-determining protein [Candidatus Roizmanbacteria bacterium RIFCSPHIGHO2_12_FULL_41_11]|uniref:Cell shape-determining protein MreB n=1 Tax=Candidatus Roizmanbacteria bacterium RIFCSPHIGHO2_12_FULL_41_11 TaxID=1802052 RepID=A0A1F7I2K7_9BACT|nr:MAG: rod shape-determining protein [Candidatus Roizmanbacteria bacterium RIFCSPHIGHO2_12_FULL_41_11]
MLSKRIGIDLGTANTLVYLAGEGIVLNEPTVVAVTAEENRVVAVGKEAKEMLGRTPGNIIAQRPLRDGVIADYTITEAMLSYFIDKATGKSRFFKPEVMVCIPSGVTQVERRAVLDATMEAGAKIAYLIDEPLAAAIGAKIPIAQAAGHMVVDIGGGSTECAVISLGGVVVHNSVRAGGNKLDEAIANHTKKKFNLLVGERTAEEIKIVIGNALIEDPTAKEMKKMEVRGRDSVTGLPRTIELTEAQISEAIAPVLLDIIAAVKGVLEQTPPELASDIIDKGVVMTGGTSLLKNLDKLITKLTGVPCHVAEDALLCVARGTGVALENIELYKRSIAKK